MRLPFKNVCLVFVGCVFCAASVWVPFIACSQHGMCGDGMNSALLPLLISVSALGAGITLILNYYKVEVINRE